MTKIKTLGLALVAVFAMSAMAASAASATKTGPHWKVKGADFLTGTETITFKNIGNTELVVGTSGKITCTSAVQEGTGNELIGGSPGTDKAKLKFTGCTAVIGGETCTEVKSEGAVNKEIKVAVNTELVYIGTKTEAEKEEGRIGDLFRTTANGNKNFVKILFKGGLACSIAGKQVVAKGDEKGHIAGVAGLIGEVEAANTEAKTKTLKFPASPKFKEKCWRWTGGAIEECSPEPQLELEGIGSGIAEQLGEGVITATEVFNVDPK